MHWGFGSRDAHARLLEEAIDAYTDALMVFEEMDSPSHVAQTRQMLTTAEAAPGRNGER